MSLFGTIIGGITSLLGLGTAGVSAGLSWGQAKETRRQQLLEEQRYEQQWERENQESQYNQGLQREIFEREDNAYQRKVADLKAAGLSPVLAAGGAGSGAGSPIKLATGTPTAKNLGPPGNPMENVISLLRGVTEMSKTQAQQKYIESQKEKVDIEKQFLEESKDLRIENLIQDLELKGVNIDLSRARVSEAIESGEMKAWMAELKRIDYNRQERLEYYLKEQYTKKGEQPPDPVFLRYQMAMLNNDLMQWNKEWFQAFNMPVNKSGNIGESMQIGSITSAVVDTLGNLINKE